MYSFIGKKVSLNLEASETVPEGWWM